MRLNDHLLMEQAYQFILEGKEPPCPCTVGKKCKKPKCPCTKCKKDKNKMMKEEMDVEGPDPLTDEEMQEAMALLNQYKDQTLTDSQVAQAFKELYLKKTQSRPTQDDMYHTSLS